MLRIRRYRADVTGVEEVDPGALGGLTVGDGVLWLDVEEPTDDEIAKVALLLNLSEPEIGHLIHDRQRTKLEHFPNHSHVALHDCTLAASGLLEREVDVVLGDAWLLSVRHVRASDRDPLPAGEVARRFETLRRERSGTDEGLILWAFLDVIVDRYFTVVDGIDERLGRVEDEIFAGAAREQLPHEVFHVRRTLAQFRRVAAPLREVLSEILRREIPGIGELALAMLRDVNDHVLRLLDQAESQREVLGGLLDAHLAMNSNRMNKVMKATSSWGAILLVATIVAGFYGMNFAVIPFADRRFGFWIVIAATLALTGGLFWVFKRRDWL